MEIKLPTEKIEPTLTEPKLVVFYGSPKSGKTTILSQLPSSLILDFENGTDYIRSVRTKILGLHPPKKETDEQKDKRGMNAEYYLVEVIRALKKSNPYKFIIVDTVTALEELCEWSATLRYMRHDQGQKWNRWTEDDFKKNNVHVPNTVKPRDQWQSVLDLGFGFGHRWLRIEYKFWLEELKKIPNTTIILSGHLKDKFLTDKNDAEVNVKDIDLTGKIKGITCADADAVGYFYRDGDNGHMSFETSDEVLCGSRLSRLSGNSFKVSKKEEDDKVTVDWSNIFTSLKK